MKNEIQVLTTNTEITNDNVNFMNELNQNYTYVTKRIKSNIENIFSNFIEIAALLHEAKQKTIYEWVGYKDIYDYALNEFNLGKTSVKNYIQIAEKCLEKSSKDENIRVGTLKEDYKDYNYSQLVELLTVPELDLDKYNPEMSVRQIRENKYIENYKQFYENMFNVNNAQSEISKFISSLEETFKENYPDEKLSYRINAGYNDSLTIRFTFNKNDYILELWVSNHGKLSISVYGKKYCSFDNLNDALTNAKEQLIDIVKEKIEVRNKNIGQTSDQVEDYSDNDNVSQTSDQVDEATIEELFIIGTFQDFCEESEFYYQSSDEFIKIIQENFGHCKFEFKEGETDVKIILDDDHYLYFDYNSYGNYDFNIELKDIKTNDLVKEYNISSLFKLILNETVKKGETNDR